MIQIDAAAIEELLDEIRRYCAVVDLFRQEGCEPRWRTVPPPQELLR